MTYKRPTVCLYHANCTDGSTAAWAIWQRFGNEVEFIPCKYGDPVVPDVEGRDVILVDFSYKFDDMLWLATHCTNVIVLDHHKTAQQELEPLFDLGMIGGTFDMNHSGAYLAWKFANPYSANVPRLVLYVEDGDLWKFELPDSKAVVARLHSLDFSFERWSELANELQYEPKMRNFVLEGETILEYREHVIDKMIDTSLVWNTMNGHKVAVVNAPYVFASDIGNRLSRIPDAEFGATFYFNNEGNVIFSLRSTDDKLDVSEIAKFYGGGGHRNAAGFVLRPDMEIIP